MNGRRVRELNTSRGFTLVELMIVTAVIGMLAALAIPAFSRVRFHSRVNATLNDFRIFYAAFQQFESDRRVFPVSSPPPGVLPPEMAGLINGRRWEEGPPVGGVWHYRPVGPGRLGGRPVLGLLGSASVLPDTNALIAIDRALDDGDLARGGFVRDSAAAYYLFLDQ